jgi:hypothetical protein
VRSVFLFFESWNAAESSNLKTHAEVSNKRAKARQTDTKEPFWRCNDWQSQDANRSKNTLIALIVRAYQVGCGSTEETSSWKQRLSGGGSSEENNNVLNMILRAGV